MRTVRWFVCFVVSFSSVGGLDGALNNKEIDPDDAYIHATDKKQFQRFVTDPDLLPQ